MAADEACKGDAGAVGRPARLAVATGHAQSARGAAQGDGGKSAGDRAENERQADCRARIGSGCVSGQDEYAGADDGPDPQRHEIDGRKRSPQRHTGVGDQRLNLAFLRFRLEHRDRLAGPEIGHEGGPGEVWQGSRYSTFQRGMKIMEGITSS